MRSQQGKLAGLIAKAKLPPLSVNKLRQAPVTGEQDEAAL